MIAAVALAITGSLLAKKPSGTACIEAEHVGLGTLLMYSACFVLGPIAAISGLVAVVAGPSRNRALGLLSGAIALAVMVVLGRQFGEWTYWCGH